MDVEQSKKHRHIYGQGKRDGMAIGEARERDRVLSILDERWRHLTSTQLQFVTATDCPVYAARHEELDYLRQQVEGDQMGYEADPAVGYQRGKDDGKREEREHVLKLIRRLRRKWTAPGGQSSTVLQMQQNVLNALDELKQQVEEGE